MDVGGTGENPHSQLVATAAVSVSALFIFQSFFRYLRSDGKKESRHEESPRYRGAMDGLVQFLAIPQLGPKTTIEKFCNLAGPALGGVAYYYSMPYGPGSGDNVEIYNEIGDGINKALSQKKCDKVDVGKLRLVGCSESFTFRDAPLPEFQKVLSTAFAGDLSTSFAKDHNLAAAVLRGPDDTLGVFLMVGPADMTEDSCLDMLTATQAWAVVLNGRLQSVRQLNLLNEHDTKSRLYAVGLKMAQQQQIIKISDMASVTMAEVMNVNKTTVWFHDAENNEIWTLPKPDFPKGLVLQVGSGIVGNVIKRAQETQDFHQSIFCTNDPNSMPSWAGSPDPSFKTKNILTVPIHVDNKLVGALQMINKYAKTDLEDSVGFGDSDLRLAEVCTNIIADQMVRLTVDTIAAKAEMLNRKKGGGGARLSFLTEYYKLEGSEAEEKVDTTEAEEERIAEVHKETQGINLTRWTIDYWNLSDAEEFQVLLQGLQRWSVPTAELEVMSRFFKSVKSTYRQNPYHNFQHALATVHYSFLLVQASKMDQYLKKSEMFALLVGALCHDLDHRGFNTAFEVTTRSELALRYNDLSPLENHHCAMTFQLAYRDDGDAGDCNIFKDMSNDFYQPMRKTMVQAILGTDMKHHGHHVTKASKFEPTADQQTEIGDKGAFIVELMMHSADIANPFMPPEISAQWNEKLCEEFTIQVNEERRLSIPVTPFMDGLTTPLAKAKSAIGFSQFVLSPLMNPLLHLFGEDGWAPAKVYLQENRQSLNDVKEREEAKIKTEA